MNNLQRLLSSSLLRCPACSGNLAQDAGTVCGNCGKRYPVLNDIPVLMPEPDKIIGLWQNRLANFIQGQQRNILSNRQMIESQTLYPPHRERLEAITRARARNLQTIMQLMAPLQALGPGTPPTEHTDSLGSFMLLVYLLRDWGWETDETEILFETVVGSLPHDFSPDSILVIGAGACRDSYNLHNHFSCKFTLSIDIAPLMLLGASRIIDGEQLDLYQILPNNVRTAHDNVSLWKLSAPRKPDNDFLYMFADATAVPLRNESFQTVLTPFIIDAVGEDLRIFARRIRNLLEPGGYWANFGAMTFLPGFSYTADEVLSIVSESGFRILRHGFREKPHLAPGESCQRQVYDCLWFSAVRE